MNASRAQSIRGLGDRMLRGAVVGTGTIAPHHLSGWSKVPNVAIVALWDRDLARARSLASRVGLKPELVTDDLDRLLREVQGLDFIDIATAPHLHRRQTEQAAARGVHVLCQKPAAVTLEDAEAMVEACRTAGVMLAINENWRWRAWYREIGALLAQRTIGRLRYARIAAHRNVTLDLPGGMLPSLLTTQAYTRDMPRLILLEWGIHLVDVLRMLLGEPIWVHAVMARVSHRFAGEDRAFLSLGFGDVVANLDLSWASHLVDELPTLLEELLIEGDGGSIALVPNRGDGDLIRVVRPLPDDNVPDDQVRPWSRLVTTARAAHDGDIATAYQASFDAAHAHFIDCLRTGRPSETSGERNLRTMRVVSAAYASAEQNRVIEL